VRSAEGFRKKGVIADLAYLSIMMRERKKRITCWTNWVRKAAMRTDYNPPEKASVRAMGSGVSPGRERERIGEEGKKWRILNFERCSI